MPFEGDHDYDYDDGYVEKERVRVEKWKKKGEKTKKGRRMVARETDARENAGEEKERR